MTYPSMGKHLGFGLSQLLPNFNSNIRKAAPDEPVQLDAPAVNTPVVQLATPEQWSAIVEAKPVGGAQCLAILDLPCS